MRFLILDDSPVSLVFLVAYLQQLAPSVEIIQSASGSDAIQLSMDYDFDAAILDYNIPDLNGIVIANEIRKIQPNCVLVLLTSNIQQSVQEEAQLQNLIYYRKPISESLVHQILVDIKRCIGLGIYTQVGSV
jgi:DNA-binding NarL/FixJ family response regulator